MTTPLLSQLLNSGTVCPQRFFALKSSLGTFLDKVPDMPPNGRSGVNNNSLLDWARQNFHL